MDKIEELLPGIEEFLTNTLATENLSSFAEERRQFFIECLDIVKLPPSLPPREGRVLPPELLKLTEESSGIPVTLPAPDFAATQREISRSLADPSPNFFDGQDGDDNSSEQGVKVYDDIEPAESTRDSEDPRLRAESNVFRQQSEDEKDDDDNDLYEIPVARQQLSAEENSLSYGGDASSMATAGSTEELSEDLVDSVAPPLPLNPPPLPPRKDYKFSESGSRSSLNADEKPPELPFRPPLPKRNELYATRSEKSDRSGDRSDPEMSGDGDSTSYESFDDEEHDVDLMNKLNIKLPKKPKKKSALKKNKKLSKSRSSSQWEISAPFRKLENINISGELYHRGKLSWNRRIVAISNGCLAMYKPDKDARPSLVIQLTGYEACMLEREGRRGFEVKISHPTEDSHTFAVDFRDWANLWVEHINGSSKGIPPPKYHTHLARSFTGNTEYGTSGATFGSKTDLTGSNSNLSTGSDGASDDSSKPRLRGNKVMRMGSFAFRATQFFENIGKKSTKPRKHSHSPNSRMTPVSSGDYSDVRTGIAEESSLSSSTSLGNISPSVFSPTSDLSDGYSFSAPSTPLDKHSPLSVFSDKQSYLEAEEDNMTDAILKGYLYIFSSFNKRRWGKRWCLVRDNMFECYRTDHSKQFELNFLLRPCVVRRALAETNSELGLMIMEGGREKITVEPLSKEDMKYWVRTLLAETSTPSVPEGLEDYLKDPVLEADAASLLSFTVLKQWDMMPSKETLSSTEYEDPMDTTLTAKQFHSAMGATDSKSEENLNCAGNVCITEQAEVKQEGETENPKLGENLASYNKNKHTTDSGFYSVKGVNSDSDSGCENSTREVEEMDCGYATLNSRSFRNAERSSKGNLVIKTPILSPLEDKKTSNTCTGNTPSSEEHCTNVCVDHNSNDCSSLHSASNTHQQTHVKISTPQVSSSVASLMDSLSYLKRPTGFSLKQSSSFTYSSTQRVLSPSGEEYSVVVKRSTKSASPEPTSVNKSDHRTTSPVLDIASLVNNSNDSQTIEVCLSEEQIPLVPTTPVPELAEVSLNEGILPSPRTSPQRSLTPIASSSPTAPSDISLSPTPYNNSSINNCLEAQEFETPSRTPPQPSERRNLKVSPLDLGQSSPSTSCNGQAVTPRSSSLSPVSSILAESPITPTMENIASLVDNPQTTSEELTSALENLKDKLSRLKKKRMAVHDKRQRANSDEERLACEKEFAALEKMAESTDLDIRVLQNHLDVLQGQTLEAMKAQRKGKSGSRRKKGKRKP